MGCDEAGRGPVIGPMVLAGLAFDEKCLRKLPNLGVKDSKKLTPIKREHIYSKLEDIVEKSCVIKLAPKLIDSYVVDREGRGKNLNVLEAEVIARMIMEIKPHVAYIDCPDPNKYRFAGLIRGMVGPHTKIVCEHKADSKRFVVAASSIVAKVIRDREVSKLRKVWGDFGSGYPSDPKTRHFLQEVIIRGDRPEIVRWSWNTLRKISSQIHG